MQVIISKNYRELSKKARDIIINEIKKNPKSNIAFATGKTPKLVYKELIRANKKKLVDFSKIKAFNLDEYYPIKKSSKQSYNYYLFKNLFNHINIKTSNIYLLNGKAKAPKKECENYEKLLKKNPIDLMILGVGTNGHIAFNEPSSSYNSKTRLVNLNKETLKRNSKYFKGINKVPAKALTIGIKNILAAKKILLLASGKEKVVPIKHLIKGKISKEFPLTYLKKHKSLIVIIDKEAAGI